MTHVAKILACI